MHITCVVSYMMMILDPIYDPCASAPENSIYQQSFFATHAGTILAAVTAIHRQTDVWKADI